MIPYIAYSCYAGSHEYTQHSQCRGHGARPQSGNRAVARVGVRPSPVRGSAGCPRAESARRRPTAGRRPPERSSIGCTASRLTRWPGCRRESGRDVRPGWTRRKSSWTRRPYGASQRTWAWVATCGTAKTLAGYVHQRGAALHPRQCRNLLRRWEFRYRKPRPVIARVGSERQVAQKTTSAARWRNSGGSLGAG